MPRSNTRHAAVMHAVGIDIADGSLELINLSQDHAGGVSLAEHARILLPSDVIVHGTIQNRSSLDRSLDALLSSASLPQGITHVVSALPDPQVVVKSIPIPAQTAGSGFDMDHLARVAFKTLAVPVRNPVVRWNVIRFDEKQSFLQLFITSRAYVQQWITFFRRHKLQLVALEMQSLALARALVHRIPPQAVVGLVDLGMRYTALSLLTHRGVIYSHTYDSDSITLRELLEERFDMPEDIIRRSLRTISLNDSDPLAETVRDHFISLFADIKKTVQELHVKPQRYIVTGADARIKGIRSYAQDALAVPVERGVVWPFHVGAARARARKPELTPFDQQLYAGALGLALRGLSRAHLSHGINFLP